jgi:hypothetical protein
VWNHPSFPWQVLRWSFTMAKLRKGGLADPASAPRLDPRELAKAASSLQELEALMKVRSIAVIIIMMSSSSSSSSSS